MRPISRRNFLGTTVAGAAVAYAPARAFDWLASPKDDLNVLSAKLLDEWLAALLQLQITTDKEPTRYGGILCPSKKIVHGRVGDAIYPFLYKAQVSNDARYLDGAKLLFRWMEANVSQPDGSWLNEPKAGSWKGTTVFAVIALSEALHHHGAILDNDFRHALRDRLRKAAAFVSANFSMTYGNINYPINAAHALRRAGEVLDEAAFITRSAEFAASAMSYFTSRDKLLWGEGDQNPSAKGCQSIDLGYNVEESLPALVQYGILAKDERLLDTVAGSMRAHLEFMLPDGAWDNSWGVRNYKWTWWGSRTTDGCQPAYALLAHKDPAFYRAALLNTELLARNTHNGLLHGGPHEFSHGLVPSVHHTFCHAKALATVLNARVQPQPAAKIPRERSYGIKVLRDIDTALVSFGGWKATATAYDKEYRTTKNGHATGGALSLLWHEQAGPIFCASMNEYQLVEADNMQVDHDPRTIPLTPRVELHEGKSTFMQCSDLRGNIDTNETGAGITIVARAKLVDKDQQDPAGGKVETVLTYKFAQDAFQLGVSFPGDRPSSARIVLPLIAASTDEFRVVDDRTFLVKKHACTLHIRASKPVIALPDPAKRIFNYVPGFEAVTLEFAAANLEFRITVGG